MSSRISGSAVSASKPNIRRNFSGDGGQVEQVQWQVSRWKSTLINAPQALEAANGDAVQVAAAAVYAEYERHLKALLTLASNTHR